MKTPLIALFIFLETVSTGSVHASPSRQAVDACLKTQTISIRTRYVDLADATASFSVEEDEGRKVVSTTLVHRKENFGIYERTESKQPGFIVAGRQVPASQVVRLSSEAPTIFNPYTSQWGEVQTPDETYLCITFNFEGLGESGSFQNIRALYLIDLERRPATIYYLVGDMRKIGN